MWVDGGMRRLRKWAKRLSRIGSWLLLMGIYLAFFLSAALYFYRRSVYADVKSWPSVEAFNVRETSFSQWIGTPGFRSGRQVSMDSVRFEYRVGGESFLGRRASANGGGLPSLMPGESRRAYYRPESPEIAVLSQREFDGEDYWLAMFASGMLVAGHLWFSISGHWWKVSARFWRVKRPVD